ncbi:unnamed protein product, partial [Staurois parvus]
TGDWAPALGRTERRSSRSSPPLTLTMGHYSSSSLTPTMRHCSSPTDTNDGALFLPH